MCQKCEQFPFSILLNISHSDSNFHKLFCKFEYDTTTDFGANGSKAKVSRPKDRVSGLKAKVTRSYMLNSTQFVISSPEHEVLMVSYCGQWLSVVVRRASCVVRQHLMFTL